jgi:hypothetical protein
MTRMKSRSILLAVIATLTTSRLAAQTAEPDGAAAAQSGIHAKSLRPRSDFDSIQDPAQRSIALFTEAGKVITYPRCMNCHPAGERPSQGDAMRPHVPLVTRGPNGLGVTAMHCSTCHQAVNANAAGVPGHPKWQLAPHSMAWQGKSLGQICEQIKDKARNGDKDEKALIEHVSDDTLVGWAWHPDSGRGPAPGTQAQFGELIKGWLETGAHCPAS